MVFQKVISLNWLRLKNYAFLFFLEIYSYLHQNGVTWSTSTGNYWIV